MTESFKRKAGEYVLESFKIYKLGETPTPSNSKDIWRLIHTWSFSESMSTGYIQGSAKVFDSDRVLDEFIGEENGWLKGEEEIEIKITDFFQNSITLKFFLYAISNVKIASGNKDNVYEYEIFFVSKEKFYGDRLSIRRSFSGAPINEFANTVFNEYFESDKEIFVQETDGDQTLVVPNYTAEETMHFFTRKAISGDELYASQTYRFFESKDGFYFGTMGWIVDDYELFSGEFDREGGVPIFVRSEVADQSPDGQLRMMSTLIDIEYPNYVNTIQDMSSGAYYKLTTELDFLNRTPLYTEYRHLDEYQNYRYPDGYGNTRSKHTKAFVDEHMNDALETLVFKDYKNPEQSFSDPNYLRPSTFYPKAYNQKNVNLYHHQNEMVKVTIYGRNEITVGDVIELKLYDINYQTEDREIDIERSGRYIIESVTNIFSGDQFTQELMISRSGIYGQPERAAAYENGPQTESVYTESGGSSAPGAGNVRRPGQAGSTGPIPSPTSSPGMTPEKAEAIRALADKYGMDPNALAGILAIESNLDPAIQGGAGNNYYGIFQLQGSQIPGLTQQALGQSLSPDQYRNLSFDDQLKVYDSYISNAGASSSFFTGNASQDASRLWALQLAPGNATKIDYNNPNAIISRTNQADSIEASQGLVTVGSVVNETIRRGGLN